MRINQSVLTCVWVVGLLTTTVVFAQSSVVSSIEAQNDQIEVVTTSPAAIYVPTWRDQQLLNAVQDYTNERVERWDSDALGMIVSRIQTILQSERWASEFDAQTIFILDESVDIVFDGIERILLPDPAKNTSVYDIDDSDVIEEELSGVDAVVSQIEKTVLAEENISIENSSVDESTDTWWRFAFLAEYEDSIIGTPWLDPLCSLYFDQIDQIAKEQNFPTSVIIATRYREHSCIFSNPSNGRGNYQITSHYYPPGPITREQFRKQILNFIDFSRAKRARYDNIQVFDEIPVVLAYDELDLTSIRKQAILYNGVHQWVTLENNVYANQNFEWYLLSRQWRDWIVQTVLKVLAWEQQFAQ